jgi:hypothetical protein
LHVALCVLQAAHLVVQRTCLKLPATSSVQTFFDSLIASSGSQFFCILVAAWLTYADLFQHVMAALNAASGLLD